MKNKIKDLLKRRPTDRVLIQAKIDQDLHGEVKAQLQKDGATMQGLIEACLKKYLMEK